VEIGMGDDFESGLRVSRAGWRDEAVRSMHARPDAVHNGFQAVPNPVQLPVWDWRG